MESRDKIDLYKDFYDEYGRMLLRERYDKTRKKTPAISTRMRKIKA